MKIGFDARCLEEDQISGVGEYTLELLKNLLEIDKKNQYIVFSNSFRQKNSQPFAWLSQYPNAKLKRFSFPNKIFNFFLWYLKQPKIDKLIGGVDIFLAPNINFLSVSAKCPLIITFHDLSFERYLAFFSWKSRWWHRYFVSPRQIAQTAQKIIAVSESTQKDLEEIYGINPEKIKVIYHGVDKNFKPIGQNNPKFSEIQKKYNLPEKFILYLGNIEPRKNILGIVRAYKNLVLKNKKFSKYKLILSGKVNSLFRHELKKENIINCGYIERKDRPFIYNLASLFIYPSFFEGFGLPVLEAMACGTPVITSNTSSLPEVAGAAAILIDPHRPDQISEAMENILADEKLYNIIKEKGFRQAQKFSWEKCAKETLSVIASVAKQSRVF